MARSLDELISAVQQEATLEGSLIALISSLKAQVAAAQGDQAKIDAAFDAVTANIATLTTAVTPADPVPVS